MSAKHTRGPWILEVGEVCCVRAQQDGGRIAMMAHLKGQFGLSGRRNASEVVANARLIAAAPDLLAALEHYLIQDEIAEGYGGGVGGSAREQARAAIAKATNTD